MIPVPCVRMELAIWRILIVLRCLLLLELSTKILKRKKKTEWTKPGALIRYRFLATYYCRKFLRDDNAPKQTSNTFIRAVLLYFFFHFIMIFSVVTQEFYDATRKLFQILAKKKTDKKLSCFIASIDIRPGLLSTLQATNSWYDCGSSYLVVEVV